MIKQKIPVKYDYRKRVEHCFRSVMFSSLASTDNNNIWNSPLWLVKDENWNLYFRSRLNSKHVHNIEKNNKVAIAIYDSKQLDAIAGLQISGKAEVLNSKAEIEKAIKYYHPDEHDMTNKEYTDKNAEFKLVKIKPTHIFIFDQQHLGDRRLEIPIEKLIKR